MKEEERALLSQRAPKHPYLEANSSTPSKGNQHPYFVPPKYHSDGEKPPLGNTLSFQRLSSEMGVLLVAGEYPLSAGL